MLYRFAIIVNVFCCNNSLFAHTPAACQPCFSVQRYCGGRMSSTAMLTGLRTG